jgi:heme-degrading monooxygenase HmoA
MVELLTGPPPMDVIARMVAIEGVEVSPTIVATQEGPERHLGPEGAGAILILQATFADEERAAGFWHTAAGLMEKLAAAPGFIRRYNFTAGPHYTLFAFWRTTADAHAFFASDEHQAAMRDLYEHRWQHSHFAGLWECAAPRERVVFCQTCDGVTPAAAGTCGGCGGELYDPYQAATRVGG